MQCKSLDRKSGNHWTVRWDAVAETTKSIDACAKQKHSMCEKVRPSCKQEWALAFTRYHTF